MQATGRPTKTNRNRDSGDLIIMRLKLKKKKFWVLKLSFLING